MNNDMITISRTELENMVNTMITNKLQQLGLIKKGSQVDSEESFNIDNNIDTSELERLIELYEDDELYMDDLDDYSISMWIRHYKRGKIDFDINDLYNTLKELERQTLLNSDYPG